jgi:hypothetical protein
LVDVIENELLDLAGERRGFIEWHAVELAGKVVDVAWQISRRLRRWLWFLSGYRRAPEKEHGESREAREVLK